MQHLDEGTIHAWLDGELPPAEREAVEAHMATCDECKAAVAEARGFVAASSRILTALDAVPGGVVPSSMKPRAASRFRSSRAWMAAAAVLVLSTATVIAVRPKRETAALSVAEVSRREASAKPTPSTAPAMLDSVMVGANGAALPAPPAEKSAANAPAPRLADERARRSADKLSKRPEAPPIDARNAVRADTEAPMMVAGAARAREPEAAADAAKKSAASASLKAENADAATGYAAPVVAQAPAPARFADSTVVVSRNTTTNGADTVVTTVYRVRGVAVTLVDRSAGSAVLQLQGRIAPSARLTAKLRDTSLLFNSLTWSDSAGRTRTLRGAVTQQELERIRGELFAPTP